MQVFRKVEWNEIDAIAEMEKVCFSDAWSRQALCDTWESANSFITIAEVEQRIVAYCIIYYVLDEAEIARIAVLPECRGLGVARGLLDYTTGVCRQKGMERMMLEVREGNVSARRLYQKAGFLEDGIRKNYYTHPQESAVLMSRLIGSSSH